MELKNEVFEIEKKYNKYIYLGIAGISIFTFFFVKVADNKTHTLYDLLRLYWIPALC